MIREFKIDDLDAVMSIWLKSNIAAHDFILESYWQKNYELVKKLLPDAAISVYEEGRLISGFIGISDEYINGIFVDPTRQSQGIGKALLKHAKKPCEELSLQVYKKNTRAIQFYLREGFSILKEQIDENTGEEELVMKWIK